MSNKISRRDWLKLIGGSAAGLMLTPMPWKILDDSAKWTQSPSFPHSALREMPTRLGRKESYKYTTCTLCRMACGVRVRCIGDQPVGLAGTPGHPVNAASLCAMGLAGHILRYHPARLLNPVKRTGKAGDRSVVPISRNECLSEIAQTISSARKGTVAILDQQPDRTISYAYRRFLGSLRNGLYVVAPAPEEIPFHLTDAVLRTGSTPFGFDVQETRTLLSFGTPVLDGWGAQGQFAAITDARCTKTGRSLKVMQVESAHSRTAQLADEWIPVRPRTESIFAGGLAHVIIKENLYDASLLRRAEDFGSGGDRTFRALAEGFTPEYVSERTGIAPERIIRIAREVATTKPSLVVFGGNPASGPFGDAEQVVFMDLNILLDSVGMKGGLVPRRKLPGPFEPGEDGRALIPETQLSAVPDHSVSVLIMDGADSGNVIPWNLLERKLVSEKAVVVSLAGYFAGLARHADYVLPSPGYMEAAGDVPSPPGASRASYASVSPLTSPPPGSIHPLDFLKGIAARMDIHADEELGSVTMDRLLKRRIANIHSHQSGSVFDPATGETRKASSIGPASFGSILGRGGCWSADERVQLPATRYSLLGGAGGGLDRILEIDRREGSDGSLSLLPIGTRGAGTIAQENPLMSKLYRESDARQPAHTVVLNPSTAKEHGLKSGAQATIRTEAGAANVWVRLDSSVMPGVMEISVSPTPASFDRFVRHEESIIEICKIDGGSSWRVTQADVEPA